MLDEPTTAAYLERISARPPDRPDLAALRHLHERHVLSVPFESLDYHLGKEVQYKDDQVIDKIVHQRRGGGCGEINMSFSLLLRTLGYAARLHHGQVWIGGRLNAPYNHLVVTAEVDGRRWLVDAGFGKGSRYPLALDTADPQPDPHGEFTVRAVDDRSTDVLCDGKPLYRFYDDPVSISDFDQVVWWYQTSPESLLRQNMFCRLPLDDGWVLLKDDLLTITRGKETRTEKLADDAAVLAAYESWFGITFEKRPTPSPHRSSSVRMAFEEK
ncbi:arylamine N-acetyltransferase [Streptomyces aurantiacus]|uniref:Acetyltransferase n=1 Tax=Streptomyces aurantiacus TaxID=47760 RepID=A0A7G1P102_9ACTN|nr:arylamine N-acetyltransferase [Streptomyces aurantiacus]BCL27590.1 acetyltransferase [Streptomyces aurantiacus]